MRCMTHRTAARRREDRERKRHLRPKPPGGRNPGGRIPDGWDFRFVPGPPVGPNVRTASPDDIAQALAGLPGDLGWEDVAPRVLPLAQRVRPYPPGLPAPVVTVVPPGLPVSLAIDIGPGHISVSSEMVEGWPVAVADVTARAMVNLHERAAEVTPEEIVWGDVDDVRTGWLQTGRGIGSSLVLAPHELVRILGDAPRLVIAPMRDLLIALPPQEVELASWLLAEIAREDPNHLPARLFELNGRTIAIRAMASTGQR